MNARREGAQLDERTMLNSSLREAQEQIAQRDRTIQAQKSVIQTFVKHEDTNHRTKSSMQAFQMVYDVLSVSLYSIGGQPDPIVLGLGRPERAVTRTVH